jgi:hypothetical protein
MLKEDHSLRNRRNHETPIPHHDFEGNGPAGSVGFQLQVRSSTESRLETNYGTVFRDKNHASLAEDDAQTLVTFTQSNRNWQSHVSRLNLLREHVDDLFNDYNELARLRDEGSPWQQQAIDQLSPLMKGMADHLTATIEYLNEHPTHVNLEPWREYVRANREYAARASSLIHDLIDYGTAKETAESLEKRMNLQANAK